MVHVEGLRDEGGEADPPGGDEVDRALVDVGVAEHVLNGGLARLHLRDVDGDRVDGNADDDGPVTGRADPPQVGVGARVAGALEDDVGPPARGLLVHDVEQPALVQVDGHGARDAGGDLELDRGDVGDHDPGGAAGQGRGGREQADRPGARDGHRVARPDARLRGGVHAHRQRLHEGALGEGDVLGQVVGEGGRVDDLLDQAAVHRRSGPEGHGGVDVVRAGEGGA